MDGKPYFSILVPVYNVQQYLDDCVQSVLNQSCRDFELILVDDGSTDSSGSLCDSYAESYPFISVNHKENKGLLHTRRFGIEKAAGSHIVFLDSDDMLLPNALETIRNAFETYSCDVVMYGWERVMDGKRVDSVQVTDTPVLIDSKRDIYLKCFCNHDFNSLCIKSVKSTVFHGFDYSSYIGLQHGEDLLQTIEILKNGSRFVLIPDILYNYRLNPDSLTNRNSFDLDDTIREKVTEFLKSENVLSPSEFNRYLDHCADIICETVIKISREVDSPVIRKQYFDRIKNSRTYKDVAAKKYSTGDLGWRCIIMNLFIKGSYGLIRTIVRIRDAF